MLDSGQLMEPDPSGWSLRALSMAAIKAVVFSSIGRLASTWHVSASAPRKKVRLRGPVRGKVPLIWCNLEILQEPNVGATVWLKKRKTSPVGRRRQG